MSMEGLFEKLRKRSQRKLGGERSKSASEVIPTK